MRICKAQVSLFHDTFVSVSVHRYHPKRYMSVFAAVRQMQL